MSSFTGTTESGQSHDPGLQLAPVGEEPPDHALLTKAFEECQAGLQTVFDQCYANYTTRFALWSGQSSDGKKHAREGSKIDPTPWDGASDLQVFLADDAINSKVAMKCLAFRKASVVAVPVNGSGTDIKRGKEVSSFMRWEVLTQIPEVGREVELLDNYLEQDGFAAMGVFWEEKQEKVLTRVTLEQIQQQFPQLQMAELIDDPEGSDAIQAIFEEQYGCTRAKAKKMLAELRKNGKTSVPTLGRKKSHPVLRAFNLNQNLFIPYSSTDIENAPAIYRVEYYSAEQLRGFANNAEWDKEWVEAAIDRCKGRLITLTQSEYQQPISRSFLYQEQRFTDLIGVVHAYQRLSDEDGYSGIYHTVFSPILGPDDTQDGYAKTGLLGTADGKYPFVLFRREYLSRKLHDSRGIPEPAKPFQQQIKVHKDSVIDAASYSILPPMMYPLGRPPTRWGAGARIPERRSGEYHFADRPAYDPSTAASEAQLRADFNQYNGFASKETDNTFAAAKNQNDVDKFMESWGDVFRMVWSLYKCYGDPQVYYNVIGVKQAEPIPFNKGDEDEEFDFIVRFQVDSLDADKVMQKLENVAKICQTADRDGITDWSELLQLMIEAIDPVIAERVLQPKDTGTQKTVHDLQTMLAKVFSGTEQDLPLGTPPQLAQQVIQNYVQNDPVTQKRLQDKQDPFGQRIQKLMKQAQFQLQQQQNATIGRIGTAPAPTV